MNFNKRVVTTLFLVLTFFNNKIYLNAKLGLEYAVWLTTVRNADWPSKGASANKQQNDLKEIVKDINSKNISKVYFQVRTRCDAFYKSQNFPWSVWLTGEIAKDPGYDPLKLCVSECNKYGIKCIPWINPFLIGKDNLGYSKESYVAKLPDSNPLKHHPEWILKCSDRAYILDIGIPEVRQLIVNEAIYICTYYDVSGIHIDDYFYPYPSEIINKDYDINTYNDYVSRQKAINKNIMSLDEWRRDNVNKFIESMHNSLKKLNKTFSVSPFGIWKNVKNTKGNGLDTHGFESYESIGCDSKKWVEEGWVDEIVPQLYWECGFDKADFVTLSDWWNDLVKNSKSKVKLLLGLAVYRIDPNAKKDCWKNSDEIKKQIEIAKSLDNVNGVSFFRYEHVKNLNLLKS